MGDADAAPLQVGKPAPQLVLHTLDGRSISSKDLQGKVVILTFWATWCSPCLAELPLLSDYAARHAAQGLEVLGFSLDGVDNLPEVRKFAARREFPGGAAGQRLGWRLWPHVAHSGQFHDRPQCLLANNGWDEKEPTWTAERLERVVTPLLR